MPSKPCKRISIPKKYLRHNEIPADQIVISIVVQIEYAASSEAIFQPATGASSHRFTCKQREQPVRYPDDPRTN
jgi:hypothetical protein